jgi:hypothetical protein
VSFLLILLIIFGVPAFFAAATFGAGWAAGGFKRRFPGLSRVLAGVLAWLMWVLIWAGLA